MASLIDRHRDQIVEVLSCYDRVVIRGTLPSICHAKAMETTLDARGIRLIRRLGNARARRSATIAVFTASRFFVAIAFHFHRYRC